MVFGRRFIWATTVGFRNCLGAFPISNSVIRLLSGPLTDKASKVCFVRKANIVDARLLFTGAGLLNHRHFGGPAVAFVHDRFCRGRIGVEAGDVFEGRDADGGGAVEFGGVGD